MAQIPKIIEFLGCDPFAKETAILGEKIHEYRRVHGLTQKKLAEKLGVDPTTLAGWEGGHHQPAEGRLEKVKSIISLKRSKGSSEP